MKRILRILKISTVVIASITIVLVALGYFYMKQEKFGQAPGEKRVAAFSASPNFKDNIFQNLETTPELVDGRAFDVMFTYFFKTFPRVRPVDTIPSVKNDLRSIPLDSNILVWFGHSSFYIQLDGKRFLADPVFSGNASPVPETNTSFAGTDIYTADDLPNIDYIFLTHDHYDHVDYETLTALRTKTGKVICGLGIGEHLELWGFSKEQIIERDWHEHVNLDSGFTAFVEPARHFSGRGLTRNNTLWASYLLQTPTMKIYMGGDSGYGSHFKSIGEKYGPIDLVMLDNGQYDSAWRYIHTLPGEVLMAASDLKARRLFPVHSSKFKMANHPWDEPLIEITRLNQAYGFPLVTPIIGEVVNLNDTVRTFRPWWVGLN
ncbi:MAG: MBL fold metallo-hydrolase [Cyclobacteriaceae bacterium]|nr:MBL fold metallo-hydrolase [Cyclobacteriaceae bacterium]